MWYIFYTPHISKYQVNNWNKMTGHFSVQWHQVQSTFFFSIINKRSKINTQYKCNHANVIILYSFSFLWPVAVVADNRLTALYCYDWYLGSKAVMKEQFTQVVIHSFLSTIARNQIFLPWYLAKKDGFKPFPETLRLNEHKQPEEKIKVCQSDGKETTGLLGLGNKRKARK